MLKQTVSYVDYNDQQQTETLFFNLTKTEMLGMLDMQPRLEAWRTKTSAAGEQMTTDDILELLNIVRDLIQKAYGRRTEDGKYFRKSAEISADFEQSAVYDAFLFDLFQNPEKAIDFMIGILPKDLGEETAREMANLVPPEITQEVSLPEVPPMTTVLKAVDEEVPAYLRENRDPTPAEFAKMSRDEMLRAFQRKNAQS